MMRICHNLHFIKKPDNSPDEIAFLKNLQKEDSGFRKIVPFSEDNSQAVLVEHEKYLCIGFRATDEKQDWRDNFNIRKVNHHGGQFHSGFYRSVNLVWRVIEEAHKELVKKTDKEGVVRPLFITGHSLGGAMATVATARWLLEGDRQFTATYTFGQPRAVTKETAKLLDEKCKTKFFRFHNNNDIVPRIPPRVIGYKHVGTVVYIDKDKAVHPNGLELWNYFKDRVRGIAESGLGRLDNVRDHPPDDYLDPIRDWALEETK